MINDSVSKLREEILALLKAIDEKMKLKLEKEDLIRLEQGILNKIEEIVQMLMKQLANKTETKKALVYLEQKINQIIIQFDSNVEKEVDGLIVKKSAISCISCDKDLEKFKGNLGDYRGWQVFPPKETSPERLGKVFLL